MRQPSFPLRLISSAKLSTAAAAAAALAALSSGTAAVRVVCRLVTPGAPAAALAANLPPLTAMARPVAPRLSANASRNLSLGADCVRQSRGLDHAGGEWGRFGTRVRPDRLG